MVNILLIEGRGDLCDCYVSMNNFSPRPTLAVSAVPKWFFLKDWSSLALDWSSQLTHISSLHQTSLERVLLALVHYCGSRYGVLRLRCLFLTWSC